MIAARIQVCARFAAIPRAARFRERSLDAALPLLAAGAVERFAADAILRGDLGAFVGRGDLPSSDPFAVRFPVSAWTPSTAIAAIVNFERNDIT